MRLKFQGLCANLNEELFHDIKEEYDAFKARALKLGVELPDLTKDVILTDRTMQFLDAQTAKVRNYINLNHTLAMTQLYQCSGAASLLLMNLKAGKFVGKKPSEAPSLLQDFIKHASQLGIDTDDQLVLELRDICDKKVAFGC